MHNAKTSLGYNIAFFRHRYDIDISTLSIQQSLCKVCVPKLDIHRLSVISQLKDLLFTRSNVCNIDGFTRDDIDIMIEYLACD